LEAGEQGTFFGILAAALHRAFIARKLKEGGEKER
jgi:hypothetical protein